MSLRRTQLFDAHNGLGAKIVPFANFEMPLQYTSIKAETLSVRSDAGIFDVGHMGELIVEGPEAEKYVDFLVTNDIQGAELNKAVYSPLCRPDGTIVDDLIVYKLRKDKILICINAANIEKDWNHIAPFAKDFNCRLTNESDHYSLIALQGPRSEKILRAIGLLPADKNPSYYSVLELQWNHRSLILARTGYTGEDGFEVFCPHEIALPLWESLLAQKAVPCGLGARDVLRLEVAFPLYGQELTDSLTPLDCGLKWTVKFHKAQFLGKEALLDYRPKYNLVKLSLEKGIPRHGHEVENEKGEVIGTVSSGTMSPILNKGIALAHIEAAKYPADNKFFIRIRDKSFPADFHQKAFIKGGHK